MKKNIYSYMSGNCRRMLVLAGILWFGAMSAAFAQKSYDYSGVVTNKAGETLPGVSVTITGTTLGTITDVYGAYKLSSDKTEVNLTFSMLGMSTLQLTVQAGTSQVIVLEEVQTELSGVMIVGYGVQKKSLVTGAISQVKAKELSSIPASRVEQALEGRVAGVNVRTSSGSPGSGLKVRIRGAGSNGNSDPLYIVDGMKTGDINYLEPSDVESIEILKDAASAAIYGNEGANGVVIITTKSGRGEGSGQKKTGGVLNYDFQYGIQSVGKMMPVMNASQYATYINEANGNTAIPTSSENNTNWLDQISQNAPMSKHYLSFAGATEKSSYMLSGSYFNQDGVIGGDKSNFKRFSFRFNGDHEIKPWLSVGNNIAYTHTNRSSLTENDEFGGIVASALMLDPLTPTVYTGGLPTFAQEAQDAGYTLVKNGAGQYYGVSEFVKGEISNPLAAIDIAKGNTVQDKVMGSVYGTLRPIKGLTITSRLGIDYAGQLFHTWYPTFWFSSERMNTTPNTRDNYDKWFTWLWENYASYNKKFDKHNFTLLAGLSAQKYTHNWVTTLSGPMPYEDENFAQHGDVAVAGQVSGNLEDKRLQSYFGRISYDYDNRYLLNVTLRRDGTSLLAPEQRWGTFPSVSAGWNISEEDFWNVDDINYLKLRASWGQNGSLSNLGPDQFRALIRTSGIQYPKPGGGFYTGAEPSLLANPELTWETSQQTDIGLDLRAFNNKLNFSVDYFSKVTKDLLTPSSPPISVGNDAPFANVGDVTNKGVEFELGYRETEGDFHYSANANLSFLHNEVTYLNPLVTRNPGDVIGTGWTATYFEKGYPVWYFRGYQTDGIFQNQAQIDAYIADNGLVNYNPKPGDPIIVNNEKDENINEDDMIMIGSPHPKMMFGLNLNCDFKGFDLNVFMQGTTGNDILMAWNRVDRSTSNRPEFFFTDRWTGEGSTNSWFRADESNPYAYNSDLMVFSGSYLRFKQIQLGYTLPTSVAERLNLKARFFVSLDDFITITKYPGMDPEANSSDANNQGVDKGFYPTPRKFMMGLSLTL
jgi:TonB-dependent starch-binding outer membrane protein SusC